MSTALSDACSSALESMVYVGAGLKPQHAQDILAGNHRIDFFEVHAENYMGEGGPPHRFLRDVRDHFALSIHGVGLSIGGAQPLDTDHLARLKRLIDRYQPVLFSEHLAWSTHEGVYFNDLLPLPYSNETLARVCDHIDQVQEFLQRKMLLENPSRYLELPGSTMEEADFLRRIAMRTGCGLLFDVSNVHVSSVNLGFDAAAYIASFPLEHVEEIHLAGFAEEEDDAEPLLIDAHDRPVASAVWDLYWKVITHAGPVPTLIEWDTDVPPFRVLADEVGRARAVVRAVTRKSAFAVV